MSRGAWRWAGRAMPCVALGAALAAGGCTPALTADATSRAPNAAVSSTTISTTAAPDAGPLASNAPTAAVGTPPFAPAPPAIVSALAPSGTLRASINVGNPVLASLDPASGAPRGVSVDLAAELARRLGVPLQLVVARRAADSVANVEAGRADFGFFAIDPARAGAIRFTPPYLTIEGAYLVRDASPITRNDQVDRDGVSVAVSRGSAYDLALTRMLHHATIVRLPLSPPVVQVFLARHLDVAAGVYPQLAEQAASLPGLRLLDGHFMEIRQAIGVPDARGDAARAYLTQFVATMTASGFVAASLARHHVSGASVANATADAAP